MMEFQRGVVDDAGEFFCSAGDVFTLYRILNDVAEEYSQYGFPVSRDASKSVIVALPDETLIFRPGEGFSIRRVSIPV